MKNAIAILLGALAACLVYSYLVPMPGDQSGDRTQRTHKTAAEAPAPAGRHDAELNAPADDDTEIVLGLRVRKDRNCTVELKDYVTPDGEMFAAYSCTPDHPGRPHPYTHYDGETLAAMAYADADAAAFLGKRLIGTDTKRAYQLLIRASALAGGELEHIAWLSDQAFGAVAVNGDPRVANIKRQYELAALAARLGDTSRKSTYLRNELIKAGVDATQLDELDAHVKILLQSMRDIQQSVLGEVTIGGQGDA